MGSMYNESIWYKFNAISLTLTRTHLLIGNFLEKPNRSTRKKDWNSILKRTCSPAKDSIRFGSFSNSTKYLSTV